MASKPTETSRSASTGRTLARFQNALILLAVPLIVVPFAITQDENEDPLANLPYANAGAFEGGGTGTEEDAFTENAFNEGNLPGGDVPTGGSPSPLFGAQPFTQQMLRFEEFGTEPMPAVYHPRTTGFPAVADAQTGPTSDGIDELLIGPMDPPPQRLANVADANPWRAQIENFLGRMLDTPPCEGRPPGEDWAHQRWGEFPPAVHFTTVQAGARRNTGVRDDRQLHGYVEGEFGPTGLYHNVSSDPASAATAAGVQAQFHPDMPVQDPNALWTFDGSLPPKLLMARIGEPILFRHYNLLPIDPAANFGFGLHTISTHEHNGHTPAESDGYTNAFFFPGQFYDYRWPMQLAGYDTINTDASDIRAGAPDGAGGIIPLRGDWRETMSTHWFHDHMLDFTAANVYKGNEAMMNYYSALDRGNEALEDGVNLRFPSGTALDWGNRDYDVNLLIADKAWTDDGQLWFNVFNREGFIGDRMLTNWLWNPYFEVRARKYRFRILNGSVSRYFKIALADSNGNPVPFHMIANDGNIMEHAIPFDGTNGTAVGETPTLAIAERYDIIVDFSNFQPGERLYFYNLLEHDDGRRPEEAIPLQDVVSGAYRAVIDDGEWEDDPLVGAFLEFRVREYDGVDLSMNPEDYEPGGLTMIPLNRPTQSELANATQRHFEFGRSSGTDSKPWTIKTDGGSGFGMDPRRLSAAPNLGNLTEDGQGAVEIWTIENGGGGWSHPIHIHFEEGIILERDGGPPPIWERYARKDVFRVGRMEDSGDSVVVALRFREFAGTYMEHCHNTQHEDHAMLMRWDLENPGQFSIMPTPIPTWDGVEYVDSVALPTFRSGQVEGEFPEDPEEPENPEEEPPEDPGEPENPEEDPPEDPGEPEEPEEDPGEPEEPEEPENLDEALAITRAEYDADKRRWRIRGNGTPGTTVDLYVGSSEGGVHLRTVTVSGDGEFEFRQRRSSTRPNGASSVSATSSLGGQVDGFPLEIDD